jgi:hypothetical protein
MGSLQTGPWEHAGSSAGGEVVAIEGNRTAIAGVANVAVWQDNSRLVSADAPWSAPGIPRFHDNQLFWGPCVVDLQTGECRTLESCRPAIWPGGGERPYVYAWSQDGARLVASYATGEAAQQTRVKLFDGQLDHAIATLWEGNELSPQAAWVGRNSVVVGFRNLRIFDTATGNEQGEITVDAGTLARLDGDIHDQRLIAVDLNRAIVWIDQLQRRVVDRWEGRWRDAALSPDGRFVAAVDLSGALHVRCLADGGFQFLTEISVPVQPASVALSSDSVAIGSGGVAMRMTLAVDCSDK